MYVCSFLARIYLSIFEAGFNEGLRYFYIIHIMNRLSRVRSIEEFHENDKDQGVERTYAYYKSSSAHLHTDKQEVDIVESPCWGKMLFLDGVLQSTTRDEVIYHNALVHPLMSTLESKKKILILGGGEGATAREVLRWPVQSVTMVDYDKELVEHMKLHGEEWSKNSLYDSRLTILYEDAWLYLQDGIQYDGVIVDLTDPDPMVHSWRLLLQMVFQSIKDSRGSFIINAGLYVPWKIEILRVIRNMVKSLCSENPGYTYKAYTSFIPSFNGEWTFIIVHREGISVKPETLPMIPAWIRRSIRDLDDKFIDKNVDTTPRIPYISAYDT